MIVTETYQRRKNVSRNQCFVEDEELKLCEKSGMAFLGGKKADKKTEVLKVKEFIE